MNKQPPSVAAAAAAGGNANNKKVSCLSEIQRLQKDRDERRKRMEQAKVDKAAEEQHNRDIGISGDVDFMRMIKNYREKSIPEEQTHNISGNSKICICIRKRPISQKEINRDDNDCVSCSNPLVIVHDCKLKVDGITKYLDNSSFEFDHTFHEDNNTDNIYDCAVQPLVEYVMNGGRATVFAYGQTGSGKTFTMQGIQSYVADDLFALLEHYEKELGIQVQVQVSYFEIYGGRCQDLLNSRQRLSVREDASGEIVVGDLLELHADSVETLHGIIETGNRNRTTHATESNDESSRSHAICQIALRAGPQETLLGRFSLIDLAGSERGADTKSHNRQRRMEGAEINKSLLALKECIRALDTGSSHVPYRASKLTLVLKDSFVNKKSKTVMIVNVSPAASSADHTLNTLRYADRIKEKVVGGQAARNAKRGSIDGLNSNNNNNNEIVSPPPQAVLIPRRSNQVLPPPAVPSSGNPTKDRNHRNKEISKVLAENISSQSSSSSSNNLLSAAAAAKNHPSLSAIAEAKNQPAKVVSPPQQQHQHKGSPVGASNEADDDDDDLDIDLTSLEDDVVNDAFHKTVQDVFEEEEDLLNMHMTVIQENAELLTEEGRLLQQIQGENNDIDAYAARLDAILQRKQQLITILKAKLDHFRGSLQKEEQLSKIVGNNKKGGY